MELKIHIPTLVEFLRTKINECNWETVYEVCPKQSNDYDCGVFVIYFADYISGNLLLNFHQSNIDKCLWRKNIGICIIKNMTKVSILFLL